MQNRNTTQAEGAWAFQHREGSWGGLITAFLYLKVAYEKHSDFFRGQVVVGNEFKLKDEQSGLDVRKMCLEDSEALK